MKIFCENRTPDRARDFQDRGVGLGQINTECRTAAIGCIDCKKLVADRVVERMTPMWDSRARLSKDPEYLNDIVAEGSRRAGEVAKATLQDVNEAMNI